MAPTASEVIATARTALGKPYVWGAEGPNAFDCSGLMQWAFGKHGIQLPRVSKEQARFGSTIPTGQARAGDLIFSTWDRDPDVDHVALMISQEEFIHAPQPGSPVQIGRITPAYMKHVTNVQRVPGLIGNIGGGPSATTTDYNLPDIAGAIRGVSSAIEGVGKGVEGVGNLAGKAMWLALPSTWVRITTGLLGVGFIFMGLRFVIQEAR